MKPAGGVSSTGYFVGRAAEAPALAADRLFGIDQRHDVFQLFEGAVEDRTVCPGTARCGVKPVAAGFCGKTVLARWAGAAIARDPVPKLRGLLDIGTGRIVLGKFVFVRPASVQQMAHIEFSCSQFRCNVVS